MFVFSALFDCIVGQELTLRITLKQPGDEVSLPFYYWDIFHNENPVGKISLRVGSNYHSYYNGNIGFEIDAAFRGHGYAAKACRMILDAAKYHGMDHLILTCKEHNIASAKTIEALGAQLLEIAEIPPDYFAWYKNIPRYRIYTLSLS